MGFSHLLRCADLAGPDLELAAGAREECSALLTRMSEIAVPSTGAAAVLSVFAALASTACGWLDGDLVIELVEEDDITTVRLMTDLGGGLREKVFHPFKLRVPLAEMTSAVERTPAILGSLNLQKISWKRISLLASEQVRRSTMPPRIGVSGESMWMLDNLVRAQKHDRET